MVKILYREKGGKTFTEIINIGKLYDYIRHDINDYIYDCKFDYLTENVGRDGNTYYWYMDEFNSVAINSETGEIIDDSEELDRLFG